MSANGIIGNRTLLTDKLAKPLQFARVLQKLPALRKPMLKMLKAEKRKLQPHQEPSESFGFHDDVTTSTSYPFSSN